MGEHGDAVAADDGPRLQGARAATLLHEAARQLGETLDPERVYEHFHELVADVIPHEGLVVSSYDPADGLIRCEYAWVEGNRIDPATLPPLALNPDGEGMQSRVILTGEALLVNDVAERVERSRGTYYDVDAEGNVRKLPESGPTQVQAALMAPVKHQGAVVGVVQVMSDQHVYTRGQLELMEGIVAQMSAAVRNARLYRAAQESEERLRAIFETAAAGIAEVGLDGAWLSVNDRLCEITGYSREELLALRFQDVTHPDDVQVDVDHARRLLAGEGDRYSLEKRYVRKDGTVVDVAITVSVVRDAQGQPVRFVSVVEDVTERKRADEERRRLLAAESAAREREQEARVLGAVGDGVALVDDDGIVRLWNPAAERLTGVAAGAILGRTVHEALPGWPEGRLPPRSGRVPEETVPIELGGRELWLSVVAVESPDGVVYAFRDLSAQRRLDEAKSELVATVSHEVRTPLAAVYGAAQTLLHRDESLTAEQRAALVGMIAGQAQRLARLADDFLLASRLERGGVPVARESVDVAAVARDAVETVSNGSAAVGLEQRAGETLAYADPDKLRQVLVNLVDNAVKYSPRGSPVTVAVTPLERRVRVTVRDAGPGIVPADRERVFEKFYRADPNLHEAPSGTGLGLYISRELVRRMEGRIGVEDAEGGGSVFWVELPRAAA